MPISAFMARQLTRPSGLFGRYVMGRLMNRLTLHHCSVVREQLEVEPKDRVLEIGFGGAALLALLCADASEDFVAGVEVSEAMLAAAPVRRAEVPPRARRSQEPRTGSQLIPGVRPVVISVYLAAHAVVGR